MTHEVKPLTGLRWFAALGVFLYHFGNPAWLPNFFKNIHLNGLFGVQFFFILSGYVLTTRYLEESPRAGQYAVARFARIGPMYYAGLALSVVYLAHQTDDMDIGLLVVHSTGLQAWSTEMDKAVSFNGPAWTISVEILFYALFPLLAAAARKFAIGVVRSFLIMVLGTLYGAVMITVHSIRFGPLPSDLQSLPNEFLWFAGLPLYYLGLFVAGIGAARFTLSVSGLPDTHPVRRVLQPTALTLGLFLALLSFNFDSPQHPYLAILVRFSLAAIPVGLMLSSLHLRPTSLASKFLGIPPLTFLGKVSYAFYIIHVPFIWSVRLISPDIPYELQFLGLVSASSILYLAFEQPLRKWLVSLGREHRH